jgi:hypothetical protein
MQSIGDSTFGIGYQARAVLAYLDRREPTFATYKNGLYDVSFETRPWYNGRERGVVISMWSPFSEAIEKFGALHVAFFEHRNGDAICTLVWETELTYWNGPVADQKTLDLAYGEGDVAARFSAGAVGEAAEWIHVQFEDFYEQKVTTSRKTKTTAREVQ